MTEQGEHNTRNREIGPSGDLEIAEIAATAGIAVIRCRCTDFGDPAIPGYPIVSLQ